MALIVGTAVATVSASLSKHGALAGPEIKGGRCYTSVNPEVTEANT